MITGYVSFCVSFCYCKNASANDLFTQMTPWYNNKSKIEINIQILVIHNSNSSHMRT